MYYFVDPSEIISEWVALLKGVKQGRERLLLGYYVGEEITVVMNCVNMRLLFEIRLMVVVGLVWLRLYALLSESIVITLL